MPVLVSFAARSIKSMLGILLISIFPVRRPTTLFWMSTNNGSSAVRSRNSQWRHHTRTPFRSTRVPPRFSVDTGHLPGTLFIFEPG